jgi:hypothetical protein
MKRLFLVISLVLLMLTPVHAMFLYQYECDMPSESGYYDYIAWGVQVDELLVNTYNTFDVSELLYVDVQSPSGLVVDWVSIEAPLPCGVLTQVATQFVDPPGPWTGYTASSFEDSVFDHTGIYYAQHYVTGEFLEDITLTITETNPVPEPTTMLLFGAGLAGLAGFGRKKFKK